MLGLLLAILPQPMGLDEFPTVESLEANYIVRPVYAEDGWFVTHWERSLSQLILRDVHPRTKQIEIVAWAGGGTERLRVEKHGEWWVARTHSGVVKSRVLFESYTDYDPEREEAHNRLPAEMRVGWPRR